MGRKAQKTLGIAGDGDAMTATPQDLIHPPWLGETACSAMDWLVSVLKDRDGSIRRDDMVHVVTFAAAYGDYITARNAMRTGGKRRGHVVRYTNGLWGPSPWMKIQGESLDRMDKAGFALRMHFEARQKAGTDKGQSGGKADTLQEFLRVTG